MTNFNRGGRALPLGQNYARLIKQNKYVTKWRRCFDSASRIFGAMRYDMLLTIFCVLFSGPDLLGTGALAQSQHRDKAILAVPAYGQEANGLGQLILSGTVSSVQDGKPIEGASVMVDKKHSRTDKQGRFTINVDKPAGILIIKHIGYKEQRVAYENTATLSIRLQLNEKQIEQVEVVSTGYQKIPKERATGSFEFVDSALFNRKVSTDIISRLEDVIPGLSSNKSSHNAKGVMLNVNVRGVSSISSNIWPLLVVDGIPYETNLADFGMGMFNNINPNDVESVSVLKDAAAASIWGARAANGVIVVTTKRGKFNSKAQVAVNSSLSIKGRPDLYYTKPMNTSDYIDLIRFFFDKGRYNSAINRWNFNAQPIIWMMKDERDGKITTEVLDSKLDALRNIDARDDYHKYIYRQAVTQSHNVQLSAGGDKMNTLFSAGLDKDKRSLVTDSYSRISLKSNSQIKPIENLLLTAGLSYLESNNVWNLEDILYRTSRNPYIRLADDNGNPAPVDISSRHPVYRDTVAGGRLLSWEHYPLKELQASKFYQKVKETILNFSAQYSFDNGLKLHGTYNYQRTINPVTNYQGLESFTTRNLINSYASYNPSTVTWNIPVGDIIYTNHWDSYIHTGRLNAEFNRTWRDAHDLNLLAGFDIRDHVDQVTTSQYYGFDPETGTFSPVAYGRQVPWWNGKVGTTTITDYSAYDKTSNRFVSYYANGSYTYTQRYILSASFRKDASNLFGVRTNERGQPFWSVGAAWILSKEGFIDHKNIDLLKLRATYGYNGNVNNRLSAYPIITVNNNPNTTTGQNFATMKSPPNPALRWERVRNINIGLDFSFYSNRLNGAVEVYDKYATDLISMAPVDPTMGFGTLMINHGNIKNRGWDASLNITALKKRDWLLTSHMMLSYTRPKVTKAYSDPNAVSYLYMAGPNARQMTPFEGLDLYSLLTYKWAGLDPMDGTPRAYLNGEISKDYSKVISSAVGDLQNHGSTNPTYFGAFRNALRYKNLEVSVNIGAQFGYVFLRESFDNDLFINYDAKHSDYSLRWQQPGDELVTDVPAFTYPNNTASSQVYRRSSVLVEKGDFIKLRDIQLSLSLPALGRYGFRNARIHAYLQNIGTIWKANDKGIDPEFGTSIPDPIMYSFGINFNL